jgi:GNAT superfamily N-acetyltransferase
MVQIKKCQSRKHKFGGCGNPRCPEGLSIKAALEDAVNKHDLNAFLAAKDMVGAKPSSLLLDRGMLNMHLSKKDQYASFKFPVTRPDAVEYVRSIDKKDLRSFSSADEMQDYLNDLYRPYANIRTHEYIDERSGYNLKRISVSDMSVDADMRGMSIGRHMRATVLKFADENNYVVTGTPTESGDGTMEHTNSNEEEFKAHALAHKARLEKFYLDSGYEYNYAFAPYGKGDYWTGEPFPRDTEWEKKLHPDAAHFLRDSGFYVRWPNNEIPKNWKAGARKPRKKPLV